MKTVNQFINRKEHISKSERFGDVFNPANGEITKKVSFANSEDVKLAIECACLLYTSPSPRDMRRSRMPSSA